MIVKYTTLEWEDKPRVASLIKESADDADFDYARPVADRLLEELHSLDILDIHIPIADDRGYWYIFQEETFSEPLDETLEYF